ncbi:MAG: papain-like cysteine protease family protein, partial [Gemmatimonadota bacterium]
MACGLSLALGASASAQVPAPPPASAPVTIDVPYLPQSELLCGGAALAMVERFWGRRGVYAEEFAGLVHPELHGIRTTDLAEAARRRGWATNQFDGTPEAVQSILADSVPVIVLIQVAPGRYHFVVLLSWSNGRVTFHDPAVAPSRSMAAARFLKAWDGGLRWAMTIAPDSKPAAQPPAAVSQAPPFNWPACAPHLPLALGVPLNTEARLEGAAASLENAMSGCPNEPVLLRELGGVRFKQRRFVAAESLAVLYVAAVPGDTLGWELLASSRYLLDDGAGALDAWNAIGKPSVDLIRIDGVRRIRFSVIATAIGIRHGGLLTRDNLTLARRRVAELPALSAASIGYQPVPGGLVEVRAAVAERPLLPP